MRPSVPLILISAGGHARSVAEASRPAWKPAGYIAPERATDPVLGGLEWLGADDSQLCPTLNHPAIIAAGVGSDGNLRLRRKLIGIYSGADFATVVSPSAIVSPTASLGEGTVVMHRAVVNACTSVGRHCVVNTGAIVEHDCRLGENVFIGPGAVVCGGVTIGDDVFIGANATVRPGVSICSGAIIGMGAAVIADITIPGTYTGVPVTTKSN